MNEIKDIVKSIVKGCSRAGTEVSDVLAAFIARTIIESNEKSFILDQIVTPDGVEQVITASIEKLLERDNPALETIKMQVDYDASYLKYDNEAQKILRNRIKLINSHKEGIVNVDIEDGNDFAALTTLYRKIFKFLLDFTPNIKEYTRIMEREVAASLESVFPRIGLKAFVQLSSNDKNVQLMELGRIILESSMNMVAEPKTNNISSFDAPSSNQSINEKIIERCVPKEVVYPRFDSLGNLWIQLYEEFMHEGY
eukprot:gene17390-22939_t